MISQKSILFIKYEICITALASSSRNWLRSLSDSGLLALVNDLVSEVIQLQLEW